MIFAENLVVISIIEEIEAQLIGQGIDANDLEVSRSFQPSDQYAGAAASTKKYQVFLSAITTTNINVERTYKVTTVGSVSTMTAEYRHAEGLVYQIECLTDYDPADENSISAFHLLTLIKRLLQHYDAIKSLKDKGTFVQNCGDVRPSYTILDRGVFESNPSFDFTVNYSSRYSKSAPSTDQIIGTIERV